MERLTARYLIETPLPVAQAAAALAGEQSTGTFVAVPGETRALKRRFAARVERISPLENAPAPALPGSRGGGGTWRRAEVTVSWPVENFGGNLPALLSTLQGNLYELAQFSGLQAAGFRRAGVDSPRGSAARGLAWPAPAGWPASRAGRCIGTIIKPSIGLTPAQTAALVRTLARGGHRFHQGRRADGRSAAFAVRRSAWTR